MNDQPFCRGGSRAGLQHCFVREKYGGSSAGASDVGVGNREPSQGIPGIWLGDDYIGKSQPDSTRPDPTRPHPPSASMHLGIEPAQPHPIHPTPIPHSPAGVCA